ncbi:MAG: hypothetical protein Q8R37_05810 [Nanoarchaeota archaeon]|nr:hypothetical protein [Nanoarchaeota archaeon]
MVSPSPEIMEQLRERLESIIPTLDNIFDDDVSVELKTTENKPSGFPPYYISFHQNGTEMARLYCRYSPYSSYDDSNLMDLVVNTNTSFQNYARRIEQEFEQNIIVTYCTKL